MNIKFSIIIPVYNVEKYLKECILSVISQTYRNIEVILVDDGSPDDCPAICDGFSAEDTRVFVIHKKNGGLSDARNCGIKEATGDYLLFVDSDDYWDDINCLEKLNQIILHRNSDVIVFGYKRFIEHRNTLINKSSNIGNHYFDNLSYAKILELLVRKDIYISSACTKAVKKSIIIENKIFFEKGVTSEDIEWSAKVAIYSKSCDYCSGDFYIYRMRKGSITTSLKEQNLIDIKNNINKCIGHSKQITSPDFYKAYMSYVSYQYITLIINTLYVDKPIRLDFVNYIKQNKHLLQYGKHKKIKTVNLFYKCFGFNIMYFLLRIFTFIRR